MGFSRRRLEGGCGPRKSTIERTRLEVLSVLICVSRLYRGGKLEC